MNGFAYQRQNTLWRRKLGEARTSSIDRPVRKDPERVLPPSGDGGHSPTGGICQPFNCLSFARVRSGAKLPYAVLANAVSYAACPKQAYHVPLVRTSTLSHINPGISRAHMKGTMIQMRPRI